MAMSAGHIIGIVALDVAFAMATGYTGIHGMIVDFGAELGAEAGIEPFDFSDHPLVDSGAEAANDSLSAANDAVHGHGPGSCDFHDTGNGMELVCH